MPGQRAYCGARIDLPKRSKIAPVTGAEKAPVDHVYDATQMSAFQADSADLWSPPEDGNFVFRKRNYAFLRQLI